ncbi:putative chromatin regulator PHD family [Helianthus annuus]|nr:putative chromatin regulator PHD family [Helianthus annuus]
MMESQNSVAESQNSDTIQPIADGLNTVDAAEVVAGGLTVAEEGSGGKEAVKRKRGRPPKAHVKKVAKPAPVKKVKEVVEDEDVCFICFDGGSLVLCDHRGCPKAYHPACIRRDAEFFESAVKWNCGWHICSICQKTAHHMCYTCTYSLCKGCIRKADYVCVRGDKGFCTICMKTIMLIENNGQGEDGKVQADFDDKLSWEYLFKVYWVYLKGKLSLTLDELTQAKNRGKKLLLQFLQLMYII